MTFVTKWDRLYRDDGEEDLDASYKQSIYNVRVLVEQDKLNVHDACNEVKEKMHLTFQEYDRLYKEAKEKYNGQ